MVKSKNVDVFESARKKLEVLRNRRQMHAERAVGVLANRIGVIERVSRVVDVQAAIYTTAARGLRAGHAVIKAVLSDPQRLEMAKRLVANTLDDLVSRGNELVTIVESASKDEDAGERIASCRDAFNLVQKRITKLS